MTKKELIALNSLLSVVRSAASVIDYYSADYDCKGLKHMGDELREAITKFRKEAKI